MSAFPGRIYSADGNALDGLAGDLSQDLIDAGEGRSMVVGRDLAPVARIWLLKDGATWSEVPQGVRESAVQLVESGQAVVILARRREAESDVRDGLLGILPDSDLAVADKAASHA